MEIVFLILKTVGIMLLIILCLFLIALALLLFVPVRYRVEGRLPEEGKPQAYIRFIWLLQLISFRVEYADGLKMTLRAAGIRVRPEQWKRRRKTPKARKMEQGMEEKGAGDGPPPEMRKPPETEKAQEIGKAPETRRSPETGNSSRAAGKRPPGPQIPKKQTWEEGTAAKEERSEKTPPSQKSRLTERLRKWAAAWKEAVRRLSKALKNAERSWERILKKLERIRETAVYYRDLLAEDAVQETIRRIWEHVKGLVFHIKPRKLSADLTIGSEDPAVTGKVLAVHGMLYPWIGDEVRIEPDFEKRRLCGKFYAEGRIRSCVVLYHILCVVLDKKTWTLIRRLKKEELTNG